MTVSIDFSTITRVVRLGVDYNEFRIAGRINKTLWRRVWVVSSITQQVDTGGYWTDDPPYQYWVASGPKIYTTYFWWNPVASGGGPTWVGDWNGGSFEWQMISVYQYLFGYWEYWWRGQNYVQSGYYEWYDPPPYYTPVYTYQTVDTSHWVYYY